MEFQKFMTVENILKVLLAIAIGVMLYKVFFEKESYDNYYDPSGYKYPMDYEEDIDLVDAVSASGDVDDIFVSADSEEGEEIEEIEEVVDAEDDIYEYADEDKEAYDDSEETVVYDSAADAGDDDMYMYEEDVVDEEQDELVKEDMVDDISEVNNFDMMYAADVEDGLQDGLQESFMLYSNLIGVDTNYA